MNLLILLTLLIGQSLGQLEEHMKLVQSDASFHIKFPKLPPPPSTNVTHPRGQYEELGMQRPPIGQVPEYFETPTPRELWDKHVKMYRPGVLRGALNGSPALHKWTDEYLASEYGDQEVLVEKKYEDRKTEPKRMGIEGFLQQYTQHNWYVVTILPNVMRKDLKVPKPLMCSTFRENMQELNLWIGTHGTRSMLHFDADNIIHCLVSGRKDWILINPDNKPLVDMVMGEPGQGSGFSHLNVDAVDLFSTPEIANVPWEYATLYAGDCLYLPPQYLHQVRSYNRSISATYLFYPRDTFDDSDCANVDLDSYLSLKDIYVYWVYEKGQETVDMGYGNPVNVRGGFEDLIKHMNMTNIDFKEYLYLMAATNSDEAIVENPLQMLEFFNKLDTNKDDVVSTDEVFGTGIEDWKELCRKSDSPHGPTKSEMGDNAEKTNASAKFNPRDNDYYNDARTTRELIEYLMKEHGYNGVLPYHVFKQYIEFKNGDHPNTAFVLIDTNMDGLIKPMEISKLELLPFRQIARMGPIYAGDKEEGLERFEQIPGHVPKMVDEEASMEEATKHHYFYQFLLKLESEIKKTKTKEISLETFQFKAEEMFSSMDDEQTNYADYPFYFKLIDRDHTGMITLKNIEWYLHSDESSTPLREIKPNKEDEPVVLKERHIPLTARRGLVNLVDISLTVSRRMKYIKFRMQKQLVAKKAGKKYRDEL